MHGGENYAREYLSFDISVLPDSSNVNNALLQVYQYDCCGNDSAGIFPHWTGYPGGDTMSCIIDHVDYGSSLDVSDWTAGDVGDPQTIINCFGTISTTPDTCWKTLNVTSCVQSDVLAKRNRSQYRMRLKIGSDYDGRMDRLFFLSGNSVVNKPMLIINYVTGVEGKPEGFITSEDIEIEHNYPNPFYRTTEIKYQLNKKGEVRLVVYDLQGKIVKLLVNGQQQPGQYRIAWNGKNEKGNYVSSGVYFCRLICGLQSMTMKMILMK